MMVAMNPTSLNREILTIMKGLGILFIALHNFLHIGSVTHFVKENENTFDISRTYSFFDVLINCDWNIFGQFFSFLGWIGVPVFLFASGYGLVKKYSTYTPLKTKDYIFHSWKKLFLLLLPAEIFSILISLLKGNWTELIPLSLLRLTMLQNFVCAWFPFTPGVHWYFGLTFELYLLYLLINQVDTKKLLTIFVGILLVQIVAVIIGGTQDTIWSLIRHNFVGWGHVFLIGMIIAKTDVYKFIPQSNMVLLFLSAICLVILPFLQFNIFVWLLFVPFVSLMFFVYFAVFIQRSFVKHIFLWLGNYSAFIFVTHPIARLFVYASAWDKYCLPLWLKTIIYIVIFILFSIIYKTIYRYLMNFRFVKAN